VLNANLELTVDVAAPVQKPLIGVLPIDAAVPIAVVVDATVAVVVVAIASASAPVAVADDVAVRVVLPIRGDAIVVRAAGVVDDANDSRITVLRRGLLNDVDVAAAVQHLRDDLAVLSRH